MQIISSLLELQARTASDEGSRQELRDNVTRIHSMALIHERLYQSENFDSVDFHHYVNGLVDMLRHSIPSQDAQRITISVNIPTIELPMDLAMPLGLILNELVSNAFEHAFPDAHGGNISISLEFSPESGILVIKDTGKGFPESKNESSSRVGLGMHLVEVLARQVGGSSKMQSSSSGTTATITFPLSQDASS